MIMKTIYKVVKPPHSIDEGSVFYSARETNANRQSYRLGVPTTNERMPLFAFDTQEHAEDFRKFGESILECQVVLSPKQPKRILLRPTLSNILFWRQIWSKKLVTEATRPIIKGTIFCSSITPLEVVKW
jgi:hypothetical protein